MRCSFRTRGESHCGPPAHFILLLLCAGALLRRARAKKRGPLQAVPVMARAMAERLE